VRDQALKHIRVVDHARHQVAGLLVLVKAERHPLQVLIDVAPRVGHHVPAGDVRHIAAHELQDALRHIDPQRQDRQARDGGHGRRAGAVAGDRGDHLADDPGRKQLHADQGQHADHRRDQGADVLQDILTHKLERFQCSPPML